MRLKDKRNITTQKAIEILRRSGIEVSQQKAAKLLDTMYFLARLIVEQNFKK